jgi:hypothetical protein
MLENCGGITVGMAWVGTLSQIQIQIQNSLLLLEKQFAP